MNSQLHGLLLPLLMSCYHIVQLLRAQNDSSLIQVDVGLILDFDDDFGKMIRTCICMALEDFYASHGRNYTTKIALHPRDSKSDVAEAVSAGQHHLPILMQNSERQNTTVSTITTDGNWSRHQEAQKSTQEGLDQKHHNQKDTAK
ncbi:hypothetical protein Vadar_032432 [Vaccinium darrowii]|uniref:Uncharacterized protein n=1 Tax=Vaccinium darrowii TaxID=229202 RepID=A0ACB7Z074_9ERIC|nr:hypothetical protein Vadar_032432 [Vaccinium darrowii]